MARDPPPRYALATACSALLAVTMLLLWTVPAQAHRLRPAMATLSFTGDRHYQLDLVLNAEAALAGIGPEHEDTALAPTAGDYDALRALDASTLAERIRGSSAALLDGVTLAFDEAPAAPPALVRVSVPEARDPSSERLTELTLVGEVPAAAATVTWHFPPRLGASALCILGAPAASAQKLYWTASGLFGPFNIQGLIPSYPEARDIKIPINMWVIDHPKGLVVYDTGNNVAISDGTCTSHWSQGSCDFLKPDQKRADVIDKQLEKLGYKTSDVKIVITSHSHLDHIGNIEMFPNAIHVLQKMEMYQARWPEKFQRPSGAHILADYDDARDLNYFTLEGDYDLFGDGSLIVLSTPGHTLGHQSVKLKLPETGTVILTQDAIWMEENLEGHPAGLNYSVKDYFNSVARLKMMSDIEGAPMWFGHSITQYEAMGETWYK